MEDNVPAAEAWVCTILFSKMVDPENSRNIAIEITAAGIADENVNPTFKPRYTFDAVKMTVIKAPKIVPLNVSSRKLFILCH